MLEKQPLLIVTVMKNEGRYILDWIAHNLALGCDSFCVATSDCTNRILDRVEKLIALKHVANPKMMFPEWSNWHVMALRYATQFNHHAIRSADGFLMKVARGIPQGSHVWKGRRLLYTGVDTIDPATKTPAQPSLIHTRPRSRTTSLPTQNCATGMRDPWPSIAKAPKGPACPR